MRTITALTFVSLDGVMQAPRLIDEDSTGGFIGGWAAPHWDEVMALVAQHAMAEPFEVLFGRTTFDMFNRHQPSRGTPLSDAKKHVVTSRPGALSWQRSVALRGEVVDAVQTLKSTSGPLVQVHGSWRLLQTLIAHDLIDEYRLFRFPVVLGHGKRLFEAGLPAQSLELIKAATTRGGAQMGFYRRRLRDAPRRDEGLP